MRRTACLLAPDFLLAARRGGKPETSRMPEAVLSAKGAASYVIAANREASLRGIGPGISLSQARILAPRLVARPRDRSAEASAQEALLETASRLSPIVENAGPGCVFLDVQGIRDEQAFADEIVRSAAAVGFSAKAGIAEGRIGARLAARLSRKKAAVLPRGEEAAYLAPFPLAWLDASPSLIDRLSRWGIKTAGALAALSAGEINRRLGAEGAALHRAAQGIDDRPLAAWRPPLTLSEQVDLEWTLCEMEPFMVVVRAMLDRLRLRMSASGVACRRLDLSLEFDPKGNEKRALPLAAPTTEVKTLIDAIHLDLAARPPAAPVAGVKLIVTPDRARQAQFSLFGPAAHAPDLLAGAIARLSILLGGERIGSPRRVAGLRPERYALTEYLPPAPPKMPPVPKRPPLAAAIRSLRPMLPLEVRWNRASLRPVSIKTAGGGASSSLPVGGKVVVASGPWKLEEGWWSEEAMARDYWDVELAGGGVYRIFRDLKENAWYADGIYD